jgi:hypothetical protein
MIRDSDHGTAQESIKVCASEEQGARHEDDHNPGNCISDKQKVPQPAAGLLGLIDDYVVIRPSADGRIVRRVGDADRSRQVIVKMRDHRNTS